MTQYNVHLYRTVRLLFEGIEADTPKAAAAIARIGLTSNADEIDDGYADDVFAQIDVAGDNPPKHSVTIDFEPERLRKAAPELLAACRMVVEHWEHGDLAAAARACSAAIAQTTAIHQPTSERSQS
jgi:hypothetical protein